MNKKASWKRIWSLISNWSGSIFEHTKSIVSCLIMDKDKHAPYHDERYTTDLPDDITGSLDKCVLLDSASLALLYTTVACGISIASILMSI